MLSRLLCLSYLVSAGCGGEAPSASSSARGAPGSPVLNVGSYAFTFGADASALPSGFTPAPAQPGQPTTACGTGDDATLCATLHEGKLTGVERTHSGTDGTYGCDTSPVFVRAALSLIEATGVPNVKAKLLFGESGLVGGSFDPETARKTRQLRGLAWTIDIEVQHDNDDIPLACAVRVSRTEAAGKAG